MKYANDINFPTIRMEYKGLVRRHIGSGPDNYYGGAEPWTDKRHRPRKI